MTELFIYFVFSNPIECASCFSGERYSSTKMSICEYFANTRGKACIPIIIYK